MTQQEYGLIKALLESGVPYRKIHEITGRANNTVDCVKASSNMDEYHTAMRAHTEKYRKPKQSESSVITESDILPKITDSNPNVVDFDGLMEALKANNELVIKLTASIDDLVRVLKPGASQPNKRWPW